MTDRHDLLSLACSLSGRFLSTLHERPVNARSTCTDLVRMLGGPVPEGPQAAGDVIADLARDVDPGLVASAGPRYFGFVTGGTLPAAHAADWLVSTWDQNCALHVMSPATSAIEAVAGRWVIDLLGLPAPSSIGFVTGAHMANVTALASARHEVLRRAGWDVEALGLQGAPRVTVFAGAQAHVSIGAACRFIGLGASTIVSVPSDDQGRMLPGALAERLVRAAGPRIVCAQAGNVNTGACDPFDDVARAAHEHGAWLHVDGAFGLWAALSPAHRHLVRGVELADSWTTDAHKWLNVPYDSGIVVVAHPGAHRAAMGQRAAYLIPGEGEQRDGMDWVPEASRRARAVPIYAAIRSLGRVGLAGLVQRCCDLARRMSTRLAGAPGVAILNDVVLNQVLVRFASGGGANITDAVIGRVQRDGVCWCGGTTWRGEAAMRISISGWQTDEEDVDRSAEAILDAHREAGR
jgi:glutamate/tyrosine decarboxylase-like PLP-dependent enzyme